eukprot:m.515837 g.515837  ORF g.515837 m.515837 type:complete len:340 (-) comp21924_c0_seq5:2124-3143(-)
MPEVFLVHRRRKLVRFQSIFVLQLFTCATVLSVRATAKFPTPCLTYNITPHQPPLYGLPPLSLSGLIRVSKGGSSSVGGSYQHGPMIGELNNIVLLAWKNSPMSEDEPGQRVFYSHSTDPTAAPGDRNGWATPTLLFPGLIGYSPHNPTENCSIALWAAPFIILRDRVYATAGTQQICLFPADKTKAASLLLRRVSIYGSSANLNGTATIELGPIFWAGPNGVAPTPCQAHAGVAAGVKNLSAMDSQTQADVASLHQKGNAAIFPTIDTSSCIAIKNEHCCTGMPYTYSVRPDPEMRELCSWMSIDRAVLEWIISPDHLVPTQASLGGTNAVSGAQQHH